MSIEGISNKGELEAFMGEQLGGSNVVGIPGVKGLPDLVTPTPWVTPAFGTGWSQYGDAEYSQVAYRRLGGQVFLRGLAAGGASGDTIFTLPEGLRPERHQIYPCCYNGGIIRVDVRSDGLVVCSGADPTFLSLDGISFWVESF